ncbi:PREDICTED: uncharacterized protein LOC104745490 [Camelina sativa]|uniref:Uncharacterized protein LOC104745490 n=1 Tax=Camelina sativa TaxID=90675 RepID=A0ABM0W373_CAMSA|nr:PREDICTED: uncharacterized protein LOC104745490 [Camelina sativa]
MLKHCFLSHNAASDLYFPFSNSRFNPASCRKKPPRLTSCVVNVGFQDIAEVIHNKVLIAAGTSAVIGQLSKPFTSVVLYGKKLDFRSVFQAGGFPSTHSSSVVAAATAIAFERGFADSIFGLTVVYAGLIMYDAQGVRREVGKHAKVLNKLTANASRSEVMSLKGNKSNKVLQADEISEEVVPPLKESIGHTEVEVIAGAFFGFLVTFSVYSLL